MATKTLERELLDLERKYWNAMKANDVDEALKLTDDPCIVAGASGHARVDKKTFRQMMTSAPWKIRDFEIKDDAEVRLLNDDVAILAYKVEEKLTVDGEPVSFEAADASTWVRRGDKWLCALHTESIVGDAYGRDRRTGKS
jgi:ketosteroid isomerase-like protein